jgi:CRP-like cAMP-binding protein
LRQVKAERIARLIQGKTPRRAHDDSGRTIGDLLVMTPHTTLSHDTHRASIARPTASARPTPATGRAAIAACIRKAFHPFALPKTVALELAACAIPSSLRAGDILFTDQAPAHCIWLVAEGRAGVGTWDVQDRWQQTRSVGTGHWLDLASAWLGAGSIEAAVAHSTLLVHAFPLPRVEALCARRPVLARAFLSALSLHAKRLSRSAHFLAHAEVLPRIARWVLDAAQEQGGHEVRLEQHKKTLAAELGTSPESISRCMSRLRQLGCIEGRGSRIQVLDLKRLQDVVDGRH